MLCCVWICGQCEFLSKFTPILLLFGCLFFMFSIEFKRFDHALLEELGHQSKTVRPCVPHVCLSVCLCVCLSLVVFGVGLLD
jgi:hypothetical protein